MRADNSVDDEELYASVNFRGPPLREEQTIIYAGERKFKRDVVSLVHRDTINSQRER